MSKEPKLQFEESYFEGETREGFYIEPMMKRAWAAQLEVVCDLREYFEKYGIQFFADWGTMLGAVRHQGFIPWDDDIDLAMTRADYHKLCEAADHDFPEGYTLYRVGEDGGMNLPFARIINSAKIDWSEEHLHKYHGCPYSIGVDIFIIDALPKEEERELFGDIADVVLGAVQLCAKDEDVTEFIPQINEVLGVKIDHSKPAFAQILLLLDEVSQLYSDAGSTEITEVYYWINRRSLVWQKEWFLETVELPFENITLPVPKEYDKILTNMFGDYMIPVRGSAEHDYPFYAKQEKLLREYLEKEPKEDHADIYKLLEC